MTIAVHVAGDGAFFFAVKRDHVADKRLAAPGGEQVNGVYVEPVTVRRERLDRRPDPRRLGLHQLHGVAAPFQGHAEPVRARRDCRRFKIGIDDSGVRFASGILQELFKIFRRVFLKVVVRVFAVGQLNGEDFQPVALSPEADPPLAESFSDSFAAAAWPAASPSITRKTVSVWLVSKSFR